MASSNYCRGTSSHHLYFASHFCYLQYCFVVISGGYSVRVAYCCFSRGPLSPIGVIAIFAFICRCGYFFRTIRSASIRIGLLFLGPLLLSQFLLPGSTETRGLRTLAVRILFLLFCVSSRYPLQFFRACSGGWFRCVRRTFLLVLRRSRLQRKFLFFLHFFPRILSTSLFLPVLFPSIRLSRSCRVRIR